MPICIPEGLPARQTLEQENIFIITEERAQHQDIRPLEIVIVNLMPTKIATETQLLRVLGNTPVQVNVTLLRTAEHVSANTPTNHLERFYQTFDAMSERHFDGMIVTGAPVELLEFSTVDYWDELMRIMAYASRNIYSTLYICWAAQAALFHHYNIPKHALECKLAGVFEHRVLAPTCSLFRGFDDTFCAPHSRHTQILRDDVERCPDLEILADSPEAGVAVLQAHGGRQIFMTGHLEYDRETLLAEYRRDVDRGLNPEVPLHYFPGDDPARQPVMNWRAHAHLFYSNWLNYYVYQATPYQLSDIGGSE